MLDCIRTAFLAGLVALPWAAEAQRLDMGVAAAPTSMDPHFHTLLPNSNAAAHIFDRLTQNDAHGRLQPGLAESWRQIDDETWEFKLRQGVTFHNGAPFTADDVAFTIARVPNVPNSPSSYAIYTRAIKAVEIVDPHTIRLRTHGLAPLLDSDLSEISVVSRSIEATSATADFNAGRAAVGTGPYRFVAYRPGDQLELVRNDTYWGAAPAWQSVRYRFIPNDGARVAALQAGDVQLINSVPSNDLPRLRRAQQIRLAEIEGVRVMYMRMDFQNETPGAHVSGPNGEPLERNPFRDLRVRQALHLSINRQAITDRILDGTAAPAGQFMAPGAYAFVPELATPAFDVNRARSLLTEAGYPNGFSLTIGTANDYYQGAAQVAQAIAQMWSRIGLRVQVDTMPYAAFAPRLGRGDFAVSIGGWTNRSGEPSVALRAVLATRDKAPGWGVANRNQYSNPAMDALLARAMSTADAGAREILLRDATRVAFEDVGLLPLYYPKNIWATRQGVIYTPRVDELTLAINARPEP